MNFEHSASDMGLLLNIEAPWRLYSSVNCIVFGSRNQAVIWTVLSFHLLDLEYNLSGILIKILFSGMRGYGILFLTSERVTRVYSSSHKSRSIGNTSMETKKQSGKT